VAVDFHAVRPTIGVMDTAIPWTVPARCIQFVFFNKPYRRYDICSLFGTRLRLSPRLRLMVRFGSSRRFRFVRFRGIADMNS
jgi:hypothetical protein